MLLTNQQVRETPVGYLKRRFENTFIIHAQYGLIYVIRIDGNSYRYKKIKSIVAAMNLDKVQEQVGNVAESFAVERAVPSTLGYFNTPFGAVRVSDRAGRQWTWGWNAERYNIENTSSSPVKLTAAVLAYCLFFPKAVYPEQFLNDEDVAVGHEWKICKDGQIVSMLRKAVGKWTGGNNFKVLPAARSLEDELRESWDEHWGIV